MSWFWKDHLVSFGVPADLKDAPGSLVRVDQLPILGAPDVDTPEMKIIMVNNFRNILTNLKFDC